MREKYVAFLRGINVGGHHKAPMAELREEMEKLKFENVMTLLNSGNVVFDASPAETDHLEPKISEHLENVFGFSVPTMVRKAETIQELLENDPFKGIGLTKDIRLYVSFLRTDTKSDLLLPWTSDDGSYRIIEKRGKNIFSILDLSVSQTPKAMEALEKLFGKDITTRNWNTIKRLEKKLGALH